MSEAPVSSIALLEPANGTIVPAGTDVVLKGEVVASSWRSFHHEVFFYLDGNIAGTADGGSIYDTNPPVTLTLTNLSEGEHEIALRLLNDCACPTYTIRAVNLAIRDPVLNSGQQLDFEVITAFPGRATVIEYSADFVEWREFERVRPTTNYSRFSAPIDGAVGRRWFRVSLAEE